MTAARAARTMFTGSSAERKSACCLLGIVTATIFLCELLIMLVLPHLPLEFSTLEHALLDAAVLSIGCAPVLWIAIVRPLRRSAASDSEKFEHLMEAVPDGVIGVAETGEIRFLNSQIESLFGYTRDELIGKPVEILIPERAAERHVRWREEYVRKPRLRPMASGLDFAGRRADGSEFPVDVNLNHVHTPEGFIVICSVRDISDQKRVNEALRDANDELNTRMRDLQRTSEELRHLNELTDLLQGCITEREASAILSRTLTSHLLGTTGGVYLLDRSRDLLCLTAAWGSAAAELAPFFARRECWGLRRGRMHTATDMESTIQCGHVDIEHNGYACIAMLAQGQVLGVLHVCIAPSKDATAEGPESFFESRRMLLIAVAEQVGLALANVRLRQELQDQSRRDALTGLFNRRYMEQFLESELVRAAGSGDPLSVLTFDLDHFKGFNDASGHEAGDAILREVGSLTQRRIRATDRACRLGGEEFVVILPGTSLVDAVEIAEDLRRAIQELTIRIRGKELRDLTASFGVAEHPRHGGKQSSLLRAADLALYEAKRAGRNRVAEARDPRKASPDTLVAPAQTGTFPRL